MRYRSKPVFVDAFQWNGKPVQGVTDIVGSVATHMQPRAFVVDETGRRLVFKIGDWVVTDDKGRRFTMDNETFQRDYERADFLDAEEPTS